MEITLKVVLTADPALLSILQALPGLKTTTETPALEKPRKATTAKQPIADPAIEAATKSTQEPTASTANGSPGAESGHTLESLRALAVPKSKAGHKDTIKKWLADAGYASLQDLQQKDFNSFHAFIEKL